MNPEIKRRWVDKLRSGTIRQIRGRLNDGTGMCCLGVLCEIALDDGIVDCHHDKSGLRKYIDMETELPSYNFLPYSVAKWAGLATIHGAYLRIGDDSDELDDHNENGRTFTEIADAIEQQL